VGQRDRSLVPPFFYRISEIPFIEVMKGKSSRWMGRNPNLRGYEGETE